MGVVFNYDGNDERATSVRDQRVEEIVQIDALAVDRLRLCIETVLEEAVSGLCQAFFLGVHSLV